MNRRNFIKTCALAGVALAIPSGVQALIQTQQEPWAIQFRCKNNHEVATCAINLDAFEAIDPAATGGTVDLTQAYLISKDYMVISKLPVPHTAHSNRIGKYNENFMTATALSSLGVLHFSNPHICPGDTVVFLLPTDYHKYTNDTLPKYGRSKIFATSTERHA